MDYPCPPFKIIILDEADSLTKDAQAALRRTMETYSKTTRFCIICNYITRIIEPLASRCAKFRFKSIPQSLYVNRIKYISDLESLPIEDQAISRLSDLTDGDLRKGIMYLQSAHRFAEISGKVTASDIEQLVGVVPTPTVEACVKLLLSKNIYQVTEWLNEFMLDGFPGYQLLIQVHDVLINHPELTSIQKSNISVLMGKVDRYLTEGAGDHLQLLQLLVGIVTILNTK
jgi:replication factor C subunit 2/4